MSIEILLVSYIYIASFPLRRSHYLIYFLYNFTKDLAIIVYYIIYFTNEELEGYNLLG